MLTFRPLFFHFPLSQKLPHPQALTAVYCRGAMVALPTVGALFVAHLAHQDFKRMGEEHGEGNLQGALAFLTAFICDAVRRADPAHLGEVLLMTCPPLCTG